MESSNSSDNLSLISLPADLIYQCLLFLELRDAASVIFATRSLYHNLYASSKEGQYYLRNLAMQELGLWNNSSGSKSEEEKKSSYYSDLKSCLKVYESKVKRMKTSIVRLYGFKTTHGVDQNIINCSISNLFCPNPGELVLYSSKKSYNVDCTGVVINEKDDS